MKIQIAIALSDGQCFFAYGSAFHGWSEADNQASHLLRLTGRVVDEIRHIEVDIPPSTPVVTEVVTVI